MTNASRVRIARGAAIMVLPSLSAVQAVALVAPLAVVVVAMFYVKRDGGGVAFYWARMFAASAAPWWQRTLYGLAARMGRVRR